MLSISSTNLPTQTLRGAGFDMIWFFLTATPSSILIKLHPAPGPFAFQSESGLLVGKLMPHVFDPRRRSLLALIDLESYAVGNRSPDGEARRTWLLGFVRTTKEGIHGLGGHTVPVFGQSLRLRSATAAHDLLSMSVVRVGGVEKQ